MRKLIAIFLLMLMPLQLTWAAVSIYCTHHEVGVAAQHLGHHADEHSKADADSGTDNNVPPGSQTPTDYTHADQCHGNAPALVSAVSQTFHNAPDKPNFFADHMPALSAAISRIERPNWGGLA